MTGRRGLVLLLCAMPGVAACRDTPKARAAELQKIAAARKQDLALRLATVDANSDKAMPLAGNAMYLMASDGKLFRFREGADGQPVQLMLFDTGLRKQREFESLTYEADSTRLLMACKRQLDKQAPKDLVIYRMPLPLNRATFTVLRVPLQQVIGSNKWRNFRPSDMTIDPFTRNYVIIASHEKGLLVLTPDGDVVRSEPLPGDHRQPEG